MEDFSVVEVDVRELCSVLCSVGKRGPGPIELDDRPLNGVTASTSVSRMVENSGNSISGSLRARKRSMIAHMPVRPGRVEQASYRVLGLRGRRFGVQLSPAGESCSELGAEVLW